MGDGHTSVRQVGVGPDTWADLQSLATLCLTGAHRAPSRRPPLQVARTGTAACELAALSSLLPSVPFKAQRALLKIKRALSFYNAFFHCKMNTILPCQDQYFVGGQSYNCPYSTTTSESSVDVSRETWVSFWAAGLLDNREPQQAPQAQESSSDSNFPVLESCSWEEDQLSSQLYRNKQLQDTLVQKEEELARLHEENNHLRQYLNSALVKCLEEKAKKLLSSDEFSKACGKFRRGKRKPKEQRYCSLDTPHSKNAKRNLSSEFATCEEQPGPPVDPWILQTLGLKDLNTIDDTVSANYSALSFPPARISSTFCRSPEDAVDYENAPREDLLIDYEGDRTTPLQSTANHREDFHFFSQLSNPPGGLQTLPYYTADVSPNKTDMAFSTSLSPHCNVKTHSFHQGQAFVRRDEEGGWKFTWVPKQS
ncbi:geminin coiled-coil domain-containing protein 1 [Orycteropus afer afer]|uniref:Geminin coiled-coil domain-containing protein 1 n=1 Tax=Orycteropus afer afer TaxID=1230840 RepID=A0A8B6ZGK7_ORYAF|nr:geminin coiled-coil domain-containing protein 1 [Orycteropus afer afer]